MSGSIIIFGRESNPEKVPDLFVPASGARIINPAESTLPASTAGVHTQTPEPSSKELDAIQKGRAALNRIKLASEDLFLDVLEQKVRDAQRECLRILAQKKPELQAVFDEVLKNTSSTIISEHIPQSQLIAAEDAMLAKSGVARSELIEARKASLDRIKIKSPEEYYKFIIALEATAKKFPAEQASSIIIACDRSGREINESWNKISTDAVTLHLRNYGFLSEDLIEAKEFLKL